MWFFGKIPLEPVVTYNRETTFVASNVIGGHAFVVEAGILEDSNGRFSPWVRLGDKHDTVFFPKRTPMTRARAVQAARSLGTAVEVTSLLSRDQMLEDEHDRSNECNELRPVA